MDLTKTATKEYVSFAVMFGKVRKSFLMHCSVCAEHFLVCFVWRYCSKKRTFAP